MPVSPEVLPVLDTRSVSDGSPDARLLAPTKLLDFHHPALEQWGRERGLTRPEIGPRERISAIYRFVRDEIAFGYYAADDLTASRVLADGYGQCNTKTTLLMALLRASGVPCRFHGATVEKALQRGVVPELVYPLAPPSILHGYAEVWFEGAFRALEGVILDAAYLDGLRRAFPRSKARFSGTARGHVRSVHLRTSGKATIPSSSARASTPISAPTTVRTRSTPSAARTSAARRPGSIES
jgi:hypothetical protein